MVTLLEDLPDEILLLICKYLSQYYIIHGFYNLNYRFNCTISQYFNSLLIKSGYVHDPERNHELLSTIGSFLQSLTVKNTSISTKDISLASNIQELTFIQTPIVPFSSLTNLTDLNIFNITETKSADVLFTNHPNLHSVFISSTSPLVELPTSSEQISTIKQLAATLRTIDDFQSLLQVCPELTCLNLNLHIGAFVIPIQTNDSLPEISSSKLCIFSLRTPYEIMMSFNHIKHILKYLPTTIENLRLEISTDDPACINGEQWENYLKEKFPSLTRMEFFICLNADNLIQDEPLRLPHILKTFQSSYWSFIIPQQIIGDYPLTQFRNKSISIFTEPTPTVRRRRYFLY